ncbi:hypothetical protein MCC02031_18960 [Bifidobacteriaceae bacterium MCC02031]|nr:hypothetical protein MCC02031_18960 [Bifidobacteriaceae bacterium MCC02031]GDZ40204.1 hypothetical protein MCC01970_09270 [Bifidobacteriaceae bacterium MCC01970]
MRVIVTQRFGGDAIQFGHLANRQQFVLRVHVVLLDLTLGAKSTIGADYSDKDAESGKNLKEKLP